LERCARRAADYDRENRCRWRFGSIWKVWLAGEPRVPRKSPDGLEDTTSHSDDAALTRRPVNLSIWGRPVLGEGDGNWIHGIPVRQIFRPKVEALAPGGAVLGGSDVIAAEVEQVVDLVVG
jgi:hypothetical protein